MLTCQSKWHLDTRPCFCISNEKCTSRYFRKWPIWLFFWKTKAKWKVCDSFEWIKELWRFTIIFNFSVFLNAGKIEKKRFVIRRRKITSNQRPTQAGDKWWVSINIGRNIFRETNKDFSELTVQSVEKWKIYSHRKKFVKSTVSLV